jgi:hypothetical protein
VRPERRRVAAELEARRPMMAAEALRISKFSYYYYTLLFQ